MLLPPLKGVGVQEAELPVLSEPGLLKYLILGAAVLSELVLGLTAPELLKYQILGQVQAVDRLETNLGPALQTLRAELFHQSCFAKTLWLRGVCSKYFANLRLLFSPTEPPPHCFPVTGSMPPGISCESTIPE